MLSLIIPAHNEEQRIAGTIRAYAAVLQNVEHEILVAIDGCVDKTGEVVRQLQLELPALQLVEFPERLGKGRGVLEGMRRARGEWVAYVDADGSLPPVELLLLVETALAGDLDAIISSRYWDHGHLAKNYGFLRWVASRTFNLIVRNLYGLPFKDTQCGAKIFRQSSLAPVIEDMKVSDYAFDVELLWRLCKAGLKMCEVTVAWNHNGDSTLRVSRAAPRMLFDVLRLRVST